LDYLCSFSGKTYTKEKKIHSKAQGNDRYTAIRNRNELFSSIEKNCIDKEQEF
jgi:hypothetical protein